MSQAYNFRQAKNRIFSTRVPKLIWYLLCRNHIFTFTLFFIAHETKTASMYIGENTPPTKFRQVDLTTQYSP